MKLSFEQALTEVWRQALVENAKVVVLGSVCAVNASRWREGFTA